MNALDQVTVQLTRIGCYKCGVTFAVPGYFERQLRETHQDFYCPNGHVQGFYGLSDTEKARDEAKAEAARQQRDAEYWRDRAKRKAEDAARAEASRRVTKGHLTRLRRRTAAGVCPCCKRTFGDLARHMAGQHPGFGKEG